ncbi:MAG: hypothetical protein RIK87_04025 [Fuerstiella sp.]
MLKSMLPLMLFFVAAVATVATVAASDEAPAPGLAAPDGWGGESISLPPGFAEDMSFKGVEHIRFAPGMMQPASDTFFCYAFVFELMPKHDLTEAVIRDEFLKYYRGLCQAVLKGKRVDADPQAFTLRLVPAPENPAPPDPDDATGRATLRRYTGILKWVEPFATRQAQTLNLEIQTWHSGRRSFLFACVAPLPKDAEIWQQLRKIRDDYQRF